MTDFNGRRGPNVSQYVANLNTIPSAHDVATQRSQEGFDLDDALSVFTNTTFFDFDMGENVDPSHTGGYDLAHQQKARRDYATTQGNDIKGMDFLNAGEYQFAELPSFPAHGANTTNSAGHPPPPPPSFPAELYPHQAQPRSITTTESSPTTSITSPQIGDKRAFDATILDQNGEFPLEDASRMAAEEDKRRRNTAASARFRVKKKQREQTLEKTAKEMSDKASQLEARIGQLEMENKWLKNLITEKNENKDDISELWKKFSKDSNSAAVPSSPPSSYTSTSRSTSEHTDGVGVRIAKSSKPHS
ncbi:MAG: hypothetical protein M1837_000889 [Sclerophora amabilis]|nr:MAG: hypothetical protein M1837_000889 [Sclerophora amabilis]